MSDHYKYHNFYENLFFPCFYPWKTDKRKVQMGNFSVQAFQVPHDVDCFGFYIKHPEMGKLLFITDAEYCPFSFKSMAVEHVIAECNFQKEYVSEDSLKRDRVLQTHMAFDTCRDFVKVNQTDRLKTVTLIHYSQGNCDIEKAVADMQKAVGKKVRVDYARAGGEIKIC